MIYAECTGYFGRFCNKSCPPGRFGHRCGGDCSPECTDEYCNPVSGCHLTTQNTTKLTVSGKGQKIKSMWDQNKLNNLININTKPNFSTDPKVYACIAWEDIY